MGLISFNAYRCSKNLLIQIFLILAVFNLANAQNSQRGLSVDPRSSAWGKYHALIVGINDYSEWPRLQTAVKDASVIRDILVSRYGFEKKNVILRTDKKASRYQVNRDLRYLATSMGPNDNLLIYYAGHGQLDDITGDGYWVPAEGKLKDPTTWISNAYIKALLSSEKVKAKNVVVIADSCYSGSMLRGGPSLMSLDDQRYQEKLAKKAALRSRQVISSGGIEPVADGGADGHSLFAFYLINALRKNDRVVVDLENLFHTKVWKPVTEIGDQRPNVGRLKTPMDQDGQFVLYNLSVDQAKPVNEQSAEIRSEKTTIASPQNLNAEEELWAIVKTSSIIEDYNFFLNEYPNGRFSSAARLKIQQIKRRQNAQRMVAAVTPDTQKQNPVIKIATPKAKVAKTGENFVKYSNGVVFDKHTGLAWYQGPVKAQWLETQQWIKSIDLDGGPWRLPAIKELETLYRKGTGKRNMPTLFKKGAWYAWSGDTRGSVHISRFNFKTGKTEMVNTLVQGKISQAIAISRNKPPIATDSKIEKRNAKNRLSSQQKESSISIDATTKHHAKSQSDMNSAQRIYKAALFPINLQSDWGHENILTEETIKEVAALFEDEGQIDFVLTYKRTEGLPGRIKLLSEIDDQKSVDVWTKRSLFSKYEPNWILMKKTWTTLDADLAILIAARIGSTNSLDLYLYDFKHEKVYSQQNVTTGGPNVASTARMHLHSQIIKFLKHQ